jgi:hypothetical protein
MNFAGEQAVCPKAVLFPSPRGSAVKLLSEYEDP